MAALFDSSSLHKTLLAMARVRSEECAKREGFIVAVHTTPVHLEKADGTPGARQDTIVQGPAFCEVDCGKGDAGLRRQSVGFDNALADA